MSVVLLTPILYCIYFGSDLSHKEQVLICLVTMFKVLYRQYLKLRFPRECDHCQEILLFL